MTDTLDKKLAALVASQTAAAVTKGFATEVAKRIHALEQRRVQVTGDGWGYTPLPLAQPYVLETLDIQPGSWFVWAPVRLQYTATPCGVSVEFGPPTPTPLFYKPSEHGELWPGTPWSDVVVPIGCVIRVAVPTELEIRVTPQQPDGVNAPDADCLIFGGA